MIRTKNENVVFYDCDETLVLTLNPDVKRQGRLVNVYHAATKKFITMQINESVLTLLLEHKHRGFYVVVWSAAGEQWAANVVKALDVVKKVDQTMGKPRIYVDDIDVQEFMPYRIYLTPESRYRK